MLSKFSVKKPLTIILSVLLILLLGVISFTMMPVDLLPKIDLPYAAVITAYPGASPEKVELSVTKPLESVLSTTSGVQTVTSISQENTSMIIFEFGYGVNMDRVMIDMNNKIGTAKAQLDDAVSSPVLMQINPDMMPIMIASVDWDGKDSAAISKIVKEEVVPSFERVDGVASVETIGLVEDSLKVTLNQKKIDALNDKVLRSVDSGLADAKQAMTEGERKLKEGRETFESEKSRQTGELAEKSKELESGKQQMQQGMSQLAGTLSDVQAQRTQLASLKTVLEGVIQRLDASASVQAGELRTLLSGLVEAGLIDESTMNSILSEAQAPGSKLKEQLEGLLKQLDDGITQADSGISAIKTQQSTLQKQFDQLLEGEKQLNLGKAQLEDALSKADRELSDQEKLLEEKKAEMESAEEEAYAKANLSGALTPKMIKDLLTAENFSMPAGSLTEGDESYSIRVGDQFADEKEVENLVLMDTKNDDIGVIRLGDVADIGFSSNVGEMYAKINGNDGILLTMQKQSTASTTEVSDLTRQTMEKLEELNSGMHITALNDQGIYINTVINSVLQNLLMGGILAILILFLFLHRFKPTFIVAVSIPISLVFAVVLMYFCGVTLNVISLAGLALGVGMLVDNSIVVIENIYRLRSDGVPAARAAVQGAKQVAGAITASTLTTICVFLPIVFTEGISRQLFADMGLTIGFSLVASLLIALTLIPALSSTMLKKARETKHSWFDKVVDVYERALRFTLRHKAMTLCCAGALLGLSIFGTTLLGTGFMPETNSNQITVTMETPKETTKTQTRALSDEIISRIEDIDGVKTVGAMQSQDENSVSMYVLLDESRKNTSQEIERLIKEETDGLDCTVDASSSGMDISAMAGSGIQIDITGDDLDQLQEIARDVAGIVEQVDGTVEVSDGLEETTNETRITVDKNRAMEYSLTVAQVYQALAQAIQSESKATTLSMDGKEYDVIVVQDQENLPKHDRLADYTIEGTKDGETVDVKLGDIASVTQAQGLPAIHHEDRARTMSVTAQIDPDHNIGLVSRELESKLANYEAPEGYKVEISGENETINNTLSDLVKMILLAIVLIYAIMAAQFQSLMSPFIVMFTLPLAFTGGLLALWAGGFDLTIVAMLGFLVLAGVVVNNGIVFVDYTNQLRLDGAEKHEALILTGRRRIRPILMTALTTILGLLTLALGIGSGSDLLQPMAVVIIFGLTYATFLTLFIVPAIYDLLMRKPLKAVDLGDGE
ncbi:efflux RND transporter permease subunit [Candidatus Soleaferrea massiliensis]|uniref:efflux RND transporter permease subunit n=1 Tax=Candidatus Soleaferrea massiliensis TaxID=1470354 RepID=UPI0005907083|nr:efflux RND transporter permease subunit [Candidatus Soleaferrea massiliensis]